MSCVGTIVSVVYTTNIVHGQTVATDTKKECSFGGCDKYDHILEIIGSRVCNNKIVNAYKCTVCNIAGVQCADGVGQKGACIVNIPKYEQYF